MGSVHIAERTADGDLLQGPIQSAVGVAHGKGAESAGDKDILAALGAVAESVRSALGAVAVRFVGVDGRPEGQTDVILAGHREFDVDVGMQLVAGVVGAVVDLVAAENAHRDEARDGHALGGCETGDRRETGSLVT